MKLASHFYGKVLADPLLRPLFKNPDENHAERMAWWLTEFLGGPALHTQKRGGFGRVVDEHRGLNITEAQRARWIEHMREAVAAAGMRADLAAEFMRLMVPSSQRFAAVSR